MEENKWYAIYTKPRWEKKVDVLLLKKSINSWCPVQKIERQWSDRKKIIEEPIFKSYVFVNIKNKEKVDVLRTDGVLNFVHYLGKPAIISDNEIETIKNFLLEKDAKISLISIEGFKQQTKVKITHGVFMNNKGTVLRSNKKKVYVQLQTLGQVMVVEFPLHYLKPEV